MKASNSGIIFYGIVMMVLIGLAGCATVSPVDGPIDEPVDEPSDNDNDVVLEQGTFEEVEFSYEEEIKASSFGSEEDYQEWVQKYAGESYYGSYALESARSVAIAEGGAMDMAVSAPQAVKVDFDNMENDFSDTNIQVEGVDEADILKTDGDYIYTITDKTLFIIKAYPGEDAEIVSTIDYDDNRPTSLFIDGDRMAVFGNYYDLDYFRSIDFVPRNGMTFFKIYDISDKEDPELVKEYKFEGRYFNGRMIGDHVYFVVQNTPEYRREYPTPVIIDGPEVKSMPATDIAFFNLPYRNPHLMTVHAININDIGSVESQSVVVEHDQNLYMSQDNMYITYTEQINEYELLQEITQELLEPLLTDYDLEVIEKIKKVDNDIMSFYEKKNKINQIYNSYLNYMDNDERDEMQEKAEERLMEMMEDYEYMEFTVVNKINVDAGKIYIDANGKVPGRILNQFSMDEDGDVFRIATTVSPRWSRFDKSRTESTNNIYTLDEDLGIMDALEGLAEGEQIYSTRFMGDRLYMVTFRQTDPFFVIDLSNPNNIKELGELKIPGFSRYLHPYDENVIIGLGRDASETGRQRGLKISLFDVSDVSNPEEIVSWVSDERYSQSAAEYEHKAFLFSKEKELLVIPAYSYSYDEREGYNGAMVFHITEDDISLRGLIDHSSGNNRYYGSAVERSLYIEELLYTKSPNLLRINEIDDLDSVKNIDLKTGASVIPIY